jgi:hypothetical protein
MEGQVAGSEVVNDVRDGCDVYCEAIVKRARSYLPAAQDLLKMQVRCRPLDSCNCCILYYVSCVKETVSTVVSISQALTPATNVMCVDN